MKKTKRPKPKTPRAPRKLPSLRTAAGLARLLVALDACWRAREGTRGLTFHEAWQGDKINWKAAAVGENLGWVAGFWRGWLADRVYHLPERQMLNAKIDGAREAVRVITRRYRKSAPPTTIWDDLEILREIVTPDEVFTAAQKTLDEHDAAEAHLTARRANEIEARACKPIPKSRVKAIRANVLRKARR